MLPSACAQAAEANGIGTTPTLLSFPSPTPPSLPPLRPLANKTKPNKQTKTHKHTQTPTNNARTYKTHASKWMKELNLSERQSEQVCVTLWPCHLRILKKNYENSNISPCQQNTISPKTKSSTRNQNPSRYQS
jgi:hypothetical protein